MRVDEKTKEKTRKKALAEARRELVAAVIAARKQMMPPEKLDELLPYPLYKIDKKARTAILANAIKITVQKDGRISSKALKPGVPKHLLKKDIDSLTSSWAKEVGQEYWTALENAIFLDKECPQGWERVRRLSRKVMKLSKDGIYRPGTMQAWLCTRCPFSAARMAGVKNIDAVGRLFKIEVSKMIESIPDAALAKNAFCWWHPVNPSTWNRLVSLTPLIKHLKTENRRMAAPFIVGNMWWWLNQWNDTRPKQADVAPDKAISMWRASLIQRGLTAAAWRWITHLSHPQLMSLVAQHSDGDQWSETIPILNHIVARQLPANNQIKWIRTEWVGHNVEDQRIAALFDAVILYRYQNRKIMGTSTSSARTTFEGKLRETLRSIKDYLWATGNTEVPPPELLQAIGAQWPNPDFENEGLSLVVPKGASFQWFVRRSEAWHKKMEAVWVARNEVSCLVYEYERQNVADATRIREDSRARTTWESALQEGMYAGYEVVPLTTGIALAEEGSEMRHCVAGYVDMCASGESRIFSIRKTGKRLATLEIGAPRGPMSWQVQQVRGKCNGRVPDEVTAVAKMVAESYTAEVRQTTRVAA